MNKISKEQLKCYLVLETSLLRIPLTDFISQITEAGITAIQLRDKHEDIKTVLDHALKIRRVIDNINCNNKPLLIINDRIDIAIASKADGVHLGVTDLPLNIVRETWPDLLIGYSCNNITDAVNANQYADYAGVGPVFFTKTKKDLRPVLELSGLKNIVSKLKIPNVAIGGITDATVSEVLTTGTDGIAVSSFICCSDKPGEAVEKLLSKFDK